MRIRRQEGYLLQKIGTIHYLLPYGQKIADQRRGMELNETAQILWEALETSKTVEELQQEMIHYYEVPEEEQAELEKDVQGFVRELLAFGAVRRELGVPDGTCAGGLEIAGISIAVYGKEDCIPKQFMPFEKNKEKKEITETADKAKTEKIVEKTEKAGEQTAKKTREKAEEKIISKEESDAAAKAENWKGKNTADLTLELVERVPESYQNGKILIRNKDLTVCAWEEGYALWFPALKNIYEIWMKEDGSYARIYYRQPMTEEEQDSLFLAIRPVFLFLAQKKGMFALHSASLLYLEKAWLFSGPSGMGKSTHTALWKKLFNTPFLNGDLNLIGKEGDRFVVYGIPWCGTSEIFTTEKKELGGIVLLEKASEDTIVPLTKEQKTLRVMQRMISPPWTAELMQKNLTFAEKIAEEKPVYFLRCTKNDTAAEVMHQRITEDEHSREAFK